MKRYTVGFTSQGQYVCEEKADGGWMNADEVLPHLRDLEAALRRLTISKFGATIHTDMCDTNFYGNGRTPHCDCGAPEARALIEPPQSETPDPSKRTGPYTGDYDDLPCDRERTLETPAERCPDCDTETTGYRCDAHVPTSETPVQPARTRLTGDDLTFDGDLPNDRGAEHGK